MNWSKCSNCHHEAYADKDDMCLWCGAGKMYKLEESWDRSKIISLAGRKLSMEIAKKKKEDTEALQRILNHADQLDW